MLLFILDNKPPLLLIAVLGTSLYITKEVSMC